MDTFTPPKDPRRQYIGMVSQARGKQWEKIIENSCTYYRDKGIADIEKTPEPMKILRDLGGGRFIACFEKAAQADYKGFTQGGKAINFEAKHTDADRLEQRCVTGDQAERLERAYQYGAHAFVLVSFGFRTFYRIPWAVWRSMKEHFGHKYITPQEVRPYMLRFGLGIDGLDILFFLDNLESEDKP